MSSIASKDTCKMKPIKFSSYEESYDSYLKKSKLQKDNFLDKSVIQTMKDNSIGSWIDKKEFSTCLIWSVATISASNALDAYSYKKTKGDNLKNINEREM